MSRHYVLAALLAAGMALPAWAAPESPAKPARDVSTDQAAEDAEEVATDKEATPAPDEEEEPAPPLKRFAITGGGALNVVMPAVQTNLGFRLPLGEDDWELMLGYGPINNAFFFTSDPPLVHTTVGMRWYLVDLTFFQLFSSLTGGYMFQYGRNSAGTETAFSGTPTVMLGSGINIMPWDHFGFTLALDAGYPFILRPELDLRVVF